MCGFIQLHRQLEDWEWYTDIKVKALFLHCLLKANFKDKKLAGVDVKRGEFLTSLTLLTECGLSKQEVRTALKKLEGSGEVSVQNISTATRFKTLVKVNRYSTYQVLKQPTATHEQHDSNTTATRQQHIILNKEIKKERNKNKDIVDSAESTPTLKNELSLDDFVDVCEFFKSETGKVIQIPTSLTKAKKSDKYKKVNARFKDGYSIDDIKKVIKLKNSQWKDDKKMCSYIQFATLFAASNFEKYLDECLNAKVVVCKNPIEKPYFVPELKNDKERFRFWLARYALYRPFLDQREINTTHRERIYKQRDIEGLIAELEENNNELLKIETQWQQLTE